MYITYMYMYMMYIHVHVHLNIRHSAIHTGFTSHLDITVQRG